MLFLRAQRAYRLRGKIIFFTEERAQFFFSFFFFLNVLGSLFFDTSSDSSILPFIRVGEMIEVRFIYRLQSKGGAGLKKINF
jgi:hypothetical protein